MQFFEVIGHEHSCSSPNVLVILDQQCSYHWDHLTSAQKRGLLYRLLHIVIEIRNLLNRDPRTYSTSDKSPLKLAVYLPVWIDNLHTPDRIWTSVQQRNHFYRCLKGFTDEITMAAYCRKGMKRIAKSIDQEKKLLDRQLRVGFNIYHLQASNEACQTWSGLNEMWTVSSQLQQSFQWPLGIDLENLTRFIDQLF